MDVFADGPVSKTSKARAPAGFFVDAVE